MLEFLTGDVPLYAWCAFKDLKASFIQLKSSVHIFKYDLQISEGFFTTFVQNEQSDRVYRFYDLFKDFALN